MKTMLDVKHADFVKSIRHVPGIGGTQNSSPELHLYILQMNRVKLKREKKLTAFRFRDIDRQLKDIEERIALLRPQIEIGFPKNSTK